MMYSNTEDKFDVHLNRFESVCGDIPLFVKYVKETWLTPYKERFVAAWTNKITHLGHTKTNRFMFIANMKYVYVYALNFCCLCNVFVIFRVELFTVENDKQP